MGLTKFKLVDTEGKSGVFYKGRTIPFDKIDDAKAEELMGKTHMIQRLAEVPAPAPVVLTLAEPEAEPTGTKGKGK